MIEIPIALSWLALGVSSCFFGALWTVFVKNPAVARTRTLIVGTLVFACALASWLTHEASGASTLLGFQIDGVNGPLLPLTALLILATMATTLRTKIRRFSFARTLLIEGLLLLTLCAGNAGILIFLLGLVLVPVATEFRTRGRSVRVFVTHHAVSLLLLTGGCLLTSFEGLAPFLRHGVGYSMIAAGVAIRAGLVPAHCWVLDLFDNAALGTSLVVMMPMMGVYASARLLLSGASETVLLILTYVAAISALYSAAASTIQLSARRFLCHTILGHSSLVLVAVILSSPLALTAGLVLWPSMAVSVTALGLTVRFLEARTGRLSLREFQGLHTQTPTLAGLFLVSGLSAAGFPGTLGFLAIELLTDAATRETQILGVLVVLYAAFSGIALIRAYGKLFLGDRHQSTVNLKIRTVELVTLLVLVALLAGGTIWPQRGFEWRRHTADELLALRQNAATQTQR